MPSDPPSPRRRLLFLAAAGSLLPCCGKEAESKAPPPPRRLLTSGASAPDWSRLDPWQGKVTRDQFLHLLGDVLTADSLWSRHVEVRDGAALIRKATPLEDTAQDAGPHYILPFAPPGYSGTAPELRYWRRLEELPPAADPARPLEGVHIALDAGHIGGSWAEMEERSSNPPGASAVVKEGDITLRTAQILAPMLEALGARVSPLRIRPEPLTAIRPEDLTAEAGASLLQSGIPLEQINSRNTKREAERLFYRAHEIRARGDRVNGKLRPDLVLCLHYNGNIASNALSTANHLHVIAHGCMEDSEFRFDDQRFEGLLRLVQRVPDMEIPLCVAVARRMAEATGLPPFTYKGSNARMVPGEPYVWMRNLLANRIYQCPVVFLEPYVMTNAEVIDRLAAGDYAGTATIAGKQRISIFREYAGGVAAGLSDYFKGRPGA